MGVERADDKYYYDLLAHGRPTHAVAAGEVIFERGDHGESVYILREGTVSLRDGDRVVESVAAPGLFGEMALIEHAPPALTAVAATGAALAPLPSRHFWVLVQDTPYFARLVMTVMARRLHQADRTS